MADSQSPSTTKTTTTITTKTTSTTVLEKCDEDIENLYEIADVGRWDHTYYYSVHCKDGFILQNSSINRFKCDGYTWIPQKPVCHSTGREHSLLQSQEERTTSASGKFSLCQNMQIALMTYLMSFQLKRNQTIDQ